VIDLSEAEDIEFAGAEELCLLAERFHKSGKSLVLAGVDSERFPSLRAAGLDRVMPLGSVSKDAAKALDYARERAWRLAVRQVSRPKAT
jgi:anti-anti-sigma regulatory factor